MASALAAERPRIAPLAHHTLCLRLIARTAVRSILIQAIGHAAIERAARATGAAEEGA
jgi:hypothetical protein